MIATATFKQADEILAASFFLLSAVETGDTVKNFYSVTDRVAVLLEGRAEWTRIAVAYESRPGVWHHLGDLMGTPEYESVRSMLTLHESGRRSDIHSDLMIVGFARIVATNASKVQA